MTSGSSRLEVRLLGPPEVLVDGAPLVVDTRKAIALLAYLTQRESAPTRDELVWLFWPESSADRGRGALRRTISSLRTGLDGRWVSADRERVHLDRDGVVVDTDLLGTASGLDTVRGRFLDGFYLRDAAPFEEWQATTASHYDRLLRGALEARSLERLGRGDTAGAVADAEMRLSIDPLDESSHRLLMRALATSGDRAGAIRQYRSCVAILDEELAVEPLPETVALNEAILAGDVAPQPDPVVAEPTPDGPVPGLSDLGLEQLGSDLRKRTATPGGTRILGPAGSGRTRLVSEALPDAVAVTAFPSDAEIPHGLSRSILLAAAAGTDDTLDERAAPAVLVAPDLAARAPEPPALEGDLAEGRLLDGIVVAVAQLLGDRVLVIDDPHLADSASQSVVDRLLERAAELGVRVVTTGTGANGAGSVSMPPLDIETVTEVAALFGHDRKVAAAVLRGTGGWVDHVLEALSSDDPSGAVEAIRRRRVLELDAIARQVLEALVILEFGTIDAIAPVSGRPPEEVAMALDRLAALGLVTDRGGTHAVSGRWVVLAVEGELGPARRALLHGRAADAHRSPAAARARHLEAAGRSAEAARAHVEAGREAVAVLANDAASRHVRAAIALGHPDPGELHFMLGEIETRAGNYPAALGALNAAAAEGTDWRIERAIGDVYARWGRWALASASLEAARDLAASPDERATVLADLAVVAVRDGRDADARSLVVEALDVAGDDAEVVARVANVAGLVLDDPEHLLRAIAHARRTNRREDEAAALNNLALAYARRGRTDEAIALAERSLALLDRTGDRHRRAAIHGNLADILHEAGDEAASREHLKVAASLFAEVGVGDWEPEIWKLTGW